MIQFFKPENFSSIITFLTLLSNISDSPLVLNTEGLLQYLLMSGFVKFCNSLIEYSFLALFFFVPLVFSSSTSELFEFNKMWVTYALAFLIAGAWITKMVVSQQIKIIKTPLDIPILLFVISQTVSTIFSLDSRISWWGYYSRFNGGLLSTLTYVFLYYALVTYVSEKTENNDPKESNFLKKSLFFASGLLLIPLGALLAAPPVGQTDKALTGIFWLFIVFSFFLVTFALPKQFLKRILLINLITAGIVALWGLPSHFGNDPTCYLFRGVMNVLCWTDAFQPMVRIFSTIGQPAWLAAYFAALIPLTLVLAFKKAPYSYSLLFLLLFIDVLFTRTRAALVAVVVSILVFYALYTLLERNNWKRLVPRIGVSMFFWVLLIFTIGLPTIPFLDKIHLPSFYQKVAKSEPKPEIKGPALETGGTESGTIRLYVWQGALDAWKHNMLFGTGVETFGFAYYRYKPIGHNLTSEWDYLYNKAHNEYLNYLTTTGAFGLLTYLAMIGMFLFTCLRYAGLGFWSPPRFALSPQNDVILANERSEHVQNRLVIFALISGYISILITNFFGFSVVITNIFLFLFPAFVFILNGAVSTKKSFVFPAIATNKKNDSVENSQKIILLIVWGLVIFYLYNLYTFWQSDRDYALGYNYDRAGAYQTAYPNLKSAVFTNQNEPVFEDELSTNNAALALVAVNLKDATAAAKLAQAAIEASNNVILHHPNNVMFWKTRVRVLSSLGQMNPEIYPAALQAALQAQLLAPTDAKIFYSVGILYLQNNMLDQAINTFRKTITLKPNYKDAYYALGLTYHSKAIDKSGKVVNPSEQEKAIEQMKYILNNFSSTDVQAHEALKEWGEQP